VRRLGTKTKQKAEHFNQLPLALANGQRLIQEVGFSRIVRLKPTIFWQSYPSAKADGN
jgi:hypothetical protein